MPKEPCPISREQFDEQAERIVVVIGEEEFKLTPKQFNTGSMGWGLQGKTTMKIAGKWVNVTIGLNVTVNGSKDLPPRE